MVKQSPDNDRKRRKKDSRRTNAQTSEKEDIRLDPIRMRLLHDLSYKTFDNPHAARSSTNLAHLMSAVSWAVTHPEEYYEKYVHHLWNWFYEAHECLQAVHAALTAKDEDGSYLLARHAKEEEKCCSTSKTRKVTSKKPRQKNT